jgi:WD40 repeat protein
MMNHIIINSDDRISALQVYKYNKSTPNTHVLAFATENRIQIHQYKLYFDNKHHGQCSFVQQLGRIDTTSQTCCLDFAPFSLSQNKLLLATGDNKHGLHLYGEQNSSTVHLPTLHKLAINQLTFVQQRQGSLSVLTCSDDHTCKLVDVETQKTIGTWFLPSAATSVDADRTDAALALVALDDGTMQLRDFRVNNPTQNKEAFRTPLQKASNKLVGPVAQAQIHPTNLNIIGAAAGTEVFIWDRRQSIQPVSGNVAHHIGGCFSFQWAPTQTRTNPGNLFATTGHDQVKIWDCQQDNNGARANRCLKTVQQQVKINGIAWVDQYLDRNSAAAHPFGCIVAHDTKLSFLEMI